MQGTRFELGFTGKIILFSPVDLNYQHHHNQQVIMLSINDKINY